MGYAYSQKLLQKSIPTICILGDGELQEGTFWESILHLFNMNLNIKLLIDFNNSIETNTLNIDQSISSLVKINHLNANSYSDIIKSIDLINDEGPKIILFRTTKLANVITYESKSQWHAGIPNIEELNDMLNKISIKLQD